ncbi:MAG: methyltransferase domain-containing protein [Asticcacaulis sp.]
MTTPRLFDRQLLRGRLQRVSADFSTANFLKVRAVEDCLDTLSAVNRLFPVALDIGSRDGTFRRELEASPVAPRIGYLIEADMVSGSAQVVMDEEALPFADNSLDLVVSSLALHTVNDLPGALVQIGRALKPDGLFIASIFGGETLKELRGVLMEAELEVRGGAGARIAPFAESYDCVDLLRRAGFNMPVVDSDKVTVSYAHPLKLIQDLRAMGETNILYDRPRKGLNRAILERAFALYYERFADADGGITATFEIITLSGWTPHESQQKPLRPGSAKMRLAEALGVKEGKL